MTGCLQQQRQAGPRSALARQQPRVGSPWSVRGAERSACSCSWLRAALRAAPPSLAPCTQALHQHRPDFLLDPANCGPPPHLSAPASSGARGKIRASQALSGAASHACRLGPAPRQWGANASGVATEQCVADCARLDAFYDPQVGAALLLPAGASLLVQGKEGHPSPVGPFTAGCAPGEPSWLTSPPCPAAWVGPCSAHCAATCTCLATQAIDKLRQLALCKDVEPGSLAAGGDTNGVASYRTRPVSPMREVCRFFLTPRVGRAGDNTAPLLAQGKRSCSKRPKNSVREGGWGGGLVGGRGAGGRAAYYAQGARSKHWGAFSLGASSS